MNKIFGLAKLILENPVSSWEHFCPWLRDSIYNGPKRTRDYFDRLRNSGKYKFEEHEQLPEPCEAFESVVKLSYFLGACAVIRISNRIFQFREQETEVDFYKMF